MRTTGLTVAEIDFSSLEWLEKNLPPNMGCYELTAHIFEILSFLLGYETLCYFVVDQPFSSTRSWKRSGLSMWTSRKPLQISQGWR